MAIEHRIGIYSLVSKEVTICSSSLVCCYGATFARLLQAPAASGETGACTKTTGGIPVKSQLGVYGDAAMGVDEWDNLIYLETAESASELLARLRPFLCEFHLRRDMSATADLGAWLTWHLARRADVQQFSGIAIDRQIRSDLDFFFRLSPGLVEVHRIDEMFEWQLIARSEIPLDMAELEARVK